MGCFYKTSAVINLKNKSRFIRQVTIGCFRTNRPRNKGEPTTPLTQWTLTFIIKVRSETRLSPRSSFCQSVPCCPWWAAGCPKLFFLELYQLPEAPVPSACRSTMSRVLLWSSWSKWLITMTAPMPAGRKKGKWAGTAFPLRVKPGNAHITSADIPLATT